MFLAEPPHVLPLRLAAVTSFQHLKLFFSASGQVHTARMKTTGQIVAIKCMDFKSQPKKEMLLTEIKVMQQYKHRNLVNYIEVRL